MSLLEKDRTKALLELLYHVSREVATALDLRTVLQRVLYEALQNVGGERCSIVVLDDAGNAVDATIVYGKQVHEHTTQQLRDTLERGLAGWVIRNHKAALILDTSKDDRWLVRPDDAVDRSGAKSAICVPLLAREQLVGVLTLVHPTPNAFSEEQLDLMQAIADQAGVAVLNARLYTESQRQARVMTALAEGAAAMNASLRMEDVYQRILIQTMQALQVETVALGMLDGETIVYRAAAGQKAGNILGRKIRLGQGITGTAALEGRGVVVPDVSQDKNYGEADKFGGIETRAILVAPIQSQGRVIGMIEAINPIAKSFDPDALLVMTGIGGLAGSTIQNAQLFERLQAAHQRYRELFEDSIDAMLITDWEGHIVEANRLAVSLSGYTREALQTLTIDQLHEVNWNRTGLKFEALREGRTCSYEASIHRDGEAQTPIEVHARRVEFDEADSIQWILRDITERKELDGLREDLTAMIYHDLRSPLANVISSLDVLFSMVPEDNKETVLTILNIAEHSTDRIQRLVSSLLDVNRLESGQPVADQKVVDPIALITQSVLDVEPTIKGRYGTIVTNLPKKLPPIWVDEDMARRVLINLMENSLKFTPQDGQFETGARREGDWVRIWVKDNGPGIPLSEQERIFDKFTRLRSGNKSSGLGIGLAFCRLAVLGHGGKIWVESEPGKGSTFHFTFPVASKEQLANKAE
ncbi:MAG TPA: GAF domain-containing protein [Anaerolineae bacterium]|nr:GAF domain-containing protein [Anaerolineales bacterium]HSD82207.1 GAF domain-containing protein [Anaerolineae bacterium]